MLSNGQHKHKSFFEQRQSFAICFQSDDSTKLATRDPLNSQALSCALGSELVLSRPLNSWDSRPGLSVLGRVLHRVARIPLGRCDQPVNLRLRFTCRTSPRARTRWRFFEAANILYYARCRRRTNFHTNFFLALTLALTHSLPFVVLLFQPFVIIYIYIYIILLLLLLFITILHLY